MLSESEVKILRDKYVKVMRMKIGYENEWMSLLPMINVINIILEEPMMSYEQIMDGV